MIGLKLGSAILAGIAGGELAWAWYSHTVLPAGEVFEIALCAALAAVLAGLGIFLEAGE